MGQQERVGVKNDIVVYYFPAPSIPSVEREGGKRKTKKKKKNMRPMQMEFFGDMEDQGATVAMDVDDVDPLEIFGEGIISIDNKLADADFFNKFEDDFDDADIN